MNIISHLFPLFLPKQIAHQQHTKHAQPTSYALFNQPLITVQLSVNRRAFNR